MSRFAAPYRARSGKVETSDINALLGDNAWQRLIWPRKLPELRQKGLEHRKSIVPIHQLLAIRWVEEQVIAREPDEQLSIVVQAERHPWRRRLNVLESMLLRR